MENESEIFEGIFDFEKEIRKGKGILISNNGYEYFVEYDQKGIEILDKRKRTFEGIRLMVGKNIILISFCFSYDFFFQFSWVKKLFLLLLIIFLLIFKLIIKIKKLSRCWKNVFENKVYGINK